MKEYGIDRDGIMKLTPPTYDESKKKVNRLNRTCLLYWKFLVSKDLSEEAEEYVCDHIDEEWSFESFEWDFGL